MNYVTKAGDTWDSIAKTEMGSEYFSDILLQANFSHAMTAIFSTGITLVIPNVNFTAIEQVNTPPWKRK